VVLDSGASGTVCGEEWYNCFLDTLPNDLKSKLDIQKGNRSYKIGSGEIFQSLYCVKAGVGAGVKKTDYRPTD
jgi:hypothetical protein